MDGEVLWEPSAGAVAKTATMGFARRLAARLGEPIDGGAALWLASVEHPGAFWDEVWEWAVIGDRGDGAAIEPQPHPKDTRFFPGSRLNLAENLLRKGGTDKAVIVTDETGRRSVHSWDDLAHRVGAVQGALAAEGVTAGDTVAAWLPNAAEALVVMLAATGLGAVFSSTSPDFGAAGVLDRFSQIEPTVVVTCDGYHYGGRPHSLTDRVVEVAAALGSVRRVVVVPFLAPGSGQPDADDVARRVDGDRGVVWSDWLAHHDGRAPTFERVPFDHPVYVLYSSGTTGTPKAIVHRTGGVVLKHLVEHRLHCDVRPGDRVFYFSTCGWMMWNWLVSALASEAAIVCHDGNPLHPRPAALFDVAEREQVTLLGVSAKFLDAAAKAGVVPVDTHDLSSVRTICSTGSPLSPEGFEYVYRKVAPHVHLASISGGTDLCGCLVAGDPTRPVRAGEIQTAGFGLRTQVFADDGTPLGAGAGTGELVCTNPFPSMPLGFWGDTSGERYQSAYWDRFDGVWAHGDWASRTEGGGFVIHGRSDATLNPGGVRIGTAEIYRQVEQMDEVAEAVAIGQAWDGDTRVVLFLRLADDVTFDDDLIARVKCRLREQCSPRHVPGVVASVDDIPRTRSGKIAELAVADVVAGRPVRNVEALANPEALDLFADRPELA
ncbi:MAG TPA: acetoacetate--CoA ligase [Acidimicrobiales bacterium]